MKIYNSSNILFHLFISYILFISILIFGGSDLGRVESYLVAFFSASLSILYLSYKFNRLFGINIAIMAMIGFYIKLLIGYIFWQFYMWPDYFINPNSALVFDHYEYLFSHNSMIKIAEHRIANNFFSLPPVVYALGQGKYIFINYIMSNLYMSGNSNLLDFSIQNTLFSFYTAVVTSLIAISFGCSKRQTKIIFIISLFQPFSFISIMIWRDAVGQFFFYLGVYLLLLSFNARMIKVLITIATSSLSMALLRSVYVFIPVLLYFIKYIKDGIISVRKILIFLALVALFSLVLSKTYLLSFLQAGYSSYLSDAGGIKFLLLLPIDYVRALIGPFPWINWFEFSDNTIFLIANYFQAVYVISIIYLTTKYYKSSKSDLKPYLTFLFFLLLSMSLVTSDIHSEYFTFAAALLLPISAKYLTINRFLMTYSTVFLGFIMLNIIYLSFGLYNQGLGSNL